MNQPVFKHCHRFVNEPGTAVAARPDAFPQYGRPEESQLPAIISITEETILFLHPGRYL